MDQVLKLDQEDVGSHIMKKLISKSRFKHFTLPRQGWKFTAIHIYNCKSNEPNPTDFEQFALNPALNQR